MDSNITEKYFLNALLASKAFADKILDQFPGIAMVVPDKPTAEGMSKVVWKIEDANGRYPAFAVKEIRFLDKQDKSFNVLDANHIMYITECLYELGAIQKLKTDKQYEKYQQYFPQNFGMMAVVESPEDQSKIKVASGIQYGLLNERYNDSNKSLIIIEEWINGVKPTETDIDNAEKLKQQMLTQRNSKRIWLTVDVDFPDILMRGDQPVFIDMGDFKELSKPNEMYVRDMVKQEGMAAKKSK